MTNVAFDVQNAKKEVRNAAFAPPFVLPVLPGSAPVLPVALRVLPFVAFAVHFAVFALPFSARVLHFVAPVLPFAAFAVHFSQVADPSPPLVTLARHMVALSGRDGRALRKIRLLMKRPIRVYAFARDGHCVRV